MDDIDRFAKRLTQGPGNQFDRIAELHGLARKTNETDEELHVRITASGGVVPPRAIEVVV